MSCLFDAKGLAIYNGVNFIFGEIPRYVQSGLELKVSNISRPFALEYLVNGILLKVSNATFIPNVVELLFRNNTIGKFNSLAVSDVCDTYLSMMKLDRFIVYNYWRLARYILIILTTIIIACVIFGLRKSKTLSARRPISVIVLVSSMIYGIMGILYLYIVPGDFQAFEYSYYTTLSIVYFGNFIWYMTNKIVQERTVRFYESMYKGSNDDTRKSFDLTNLKNDSFSKEIKGIDHLMRLMSIIPDDLRYSMTIFIVAFFNIPFIHILYFSIIGAEPYPNFGLSISIVKFAWPIIGTLIPALVVFIWDIATGKTSRIDPLRYKREFFITVILCLPTAISTFVIGTSDSAIVSYAITKKVILLCFHGVSYIIFDILFIFCISGLISIIEIPKRNKGFEKMEVNTPTDNNAKIKRKHIVLDFIRQHGQKVVEEYCESSGLYDYWGMLKFISSVNPKKDSDIERKVLMFTTIFGNQESRKSIFVDIWKIGNQKGMPIDTLHDQLVSLIKKVLYDKMSSGGFFESEHFSNFVEDNEQLFSSELEKINTLVLGSTGSNSGSNVTADDISDISAIDMIDLSE